MACVFILPVEHLPHFVEAAQGKQHQDGFGLVVDLRGAQVLGPAFQHIGALSRAQAHLGKHARRQADRQTDTGHVQGTERTR